MGKISVVQGFKEVLKPVEIPRPPPALTLRWFYNPFLPPAMSGFAGWTIQVVCFASLGT